MLEQPRGYYPENFESEAAPQARKKGLALRTLRPLRIPNLSQNLSRRLFFGFRWRGGPNLSKMCRKFEERQFPDKLFFDRLLTNLGGPDWNPEKQLPGQIWGSGASLNAVRGRTVRKKGLERNLICRPALSGIRNGHFPESEYFSQAEISRKSLKNAERAIFAKFQAPKFQNAEPKKMQFHTPSRSIPPLDSLLICEEDQIPTFLSSADLVLRGREVPIFLWPLRADSCGGRRKSSKLKQRVRAQLRWPRAVA